ncbi:hypothetical protein FKP32DRAFT_200403 [Trametes sanguinea]|nr:hypothetical protein FKP32DRAFT_200403 [Trametes sanguinea]
MLERRTRVDASWTPGAWTPHAGAYYPVTKDDEALQRPPYSNGPTSPPDAPAREPLRMRRETSASVPGSRPCCRTTTSGPSACFRGPHTAYNDVCCAQHA